jgi:anti-sigma B factor antagonist
MGRQVTAFDRSHEHSISATGEIDVASAPELRRALLERIDASDKGERVVLDLREVSFIDSTGLGVLVGARRRAIDHGTQLILANPRPPTLRVIDITGLAALFEIRYDLDA